MSLLARGKLIVVEGIDGSGKSTLISRLSENFETWSRTFAVMCFPDRSTPTGRMINEYLASKNDNSIEDPFQNECRARVIHLLFSANRWECMAQIESLLSQGTSVLLDRYVYSGIAYSYASELLPFQWCFSADDGHIEPDLLIYLHLPVDIAQDRC